MTTQTTTYQFEFDGPVDVGALVHAPYYPLRPGEGANAPVRKVPFGTRFRVIRVRHIPHDELAGGPIWIAHAEEIPPCEHIEFDEAQDGTMKCRACGREADTCPDCGEAGTCWPSCPQVTDRAPRGEE